MSVIEIGLPIGEELLKKFAKLFDDFFVVFLNLYIQSSAKHKQANVKEVLGISPKCYLTDCHVVLQKCGI